MFTERVLLNKKYECNGFDLVFKHGISESYSVIIAHHSLTRDSDGSKIRKVYSFSRAHAAREFLRNFMNSDFSSQDRFFDSEKKDLPSALKSPGAPLKNQNAAKPGELVKIQFRLDDQQVIQFLRDYGSDSIALNARAFILDHCLFSDRD